MLKISRATSVIKKPALEPIQKTVFDERAASDARVGLSILRCTFLSAVANRNRRQLMPLRWRFQLKQSIRVTRLALTDAKISATLRLRVEAGRCRNRAGNEFFRVAFWGVKRGFFALQSGFLGPGERHKSRNSWIITSYLCFAAKLGKKAPNTPDPPAPPRTAWSAFY